MKRFLLIALAVPQILHAQSLSTLSDAEAANKDALFAFHQSGYQLVDPAGDFSVYKVASEIPKQMWYSLSKDERAAINKVTKDDISPYEDLNYMEPEVKKYVPVATAGEFEDLLSIISSQQPGLEKLFSQLPEVTPTDREYNDARFFTLIDNLNASIQGRSNPLIRKGFKKMFAQVITEEKAAGIQPTYGEPHKWSEEFSRKYKMRSPLLINSKLLLALSMGRTNRYMVSGTEETLYKWAVSQERNSITLPEMFRASYRINNGDVYKTLLTIENILANQWRNVRRELLPMTQRLKPIALGFMYSEDRFGTWYHLFGMMLYGYVEGGLRADFVGRIEALGSSMLSPKINKTQKQWMNKAGGDLGDDLAEMVKKNSFATDKLDEEALKDETFLRQSEDYRDRIQVASDPAISAKLNGLENSLELSSSTLDLKKCQLELLVDSGQGYNSRRVQKLKNVNLNAKRKFISLGDKSEVIQKVRGFVSCEGQSGNRAFETK
ncbi:MAG: hypothetical protein V4736_03930 [Bdellovibrionota bacterium]